MNVENLTDAPPEISVCFFLVLLFPLCEPPRIELGGVGIDVRVQVNVGYRIDEEVASLNSSIRQKNVFPEISTYSCTTRGNSESLANDEIQRW